MLTAYHPLPAAKPVALGGSALTLNAPGTLVIKSHPRENLTTAITVDVVDAVLRIREVAINTEANAPADTEVTTDDLRNARVIELIRENLPQYVEALSLTWTFPLPEDAAAAIRKAWPATFAKTMVAEVYGFARAIRLPPIKAVTENFGISRATAHRWADACRTEGFIVG